ncbi:MAG TPA: DinB family protein [Ktedonobacterales bacterium]|nr:DinB family protein [Ktedonobacterales bacterium]
MTSDERQVQRDEQATIPDQMRAEHARLEALLAGMSDEELVRPEAFGAWSVKDMLAHITFWEQRVIAYSDGAKESLVGPDEDEQAAVDRINAEVLAANREQPLAEVRADFERSYQQVLRLAESLSADDLADDVLYSLFAGDTFEHYREHIEMLENGQHKE